MSIQPDLVGTITLTSGSTAFTWAGTSLVSANIQPGDQILLPAKAMVLTIATVTGATTGTLTNNCPAGAAGAGQAARIRYQSDLSRVAAQMRELIDLLGSGNVSALAGLTGAGDRGVHFTGAGVMATHTLTALGRAIAGLTGANGKFPVATGAGAAEMRDIVGTVAQSGGVPTGSIIERGSNGAGEYIRFADGMQICTRSVNSFLVNVTSSYRLLYRSANLDYNFPAAFSVAPTVTCGRISAFGESLIMEVGSTGSAWQVRFAALEAASNVNMGSFYLIAIGRWFG